MLGFKQLSDKLKTFKVGETGYFFLVDDQGRFIAHPNDDQFLKQANEIAGVSELLKNRSIHNITSNIDGSEHHIFSTLIPTTGWTLFLSIEEEELHQSIKYVEKITTVFSFLFVIIIVIIVLISYKGVWFYACRRNHEHIRLFYI